MNMTPFYLVVDYDRKEVYMNLFEKKEDVEAYLKDVCDENDVEEVFDANSCNEYLKKHNGYIAEVFTGHYLLG